VRDAVTASGLPSSGQRSPATSAKPGKQGRKARDKESQTKSPLKEKPLRYPGQSLDEQIGDEFIDDEYFTYLVLLAGWVAVAAAWYTLFQPRVATCVGMTLAVAGHTVLGLRRARRGRKTRERLKQGRDGERVVGQMLEDLREHGYKVFHDLKGTDFNVDHVVIGPGGVFSIETKTISKPKRGPCEVEFDGHSVRVNGHRPDRDPIVQALTQSRWVKDLLHQVSGKRVHVTPIVVYPGWFVRRTAPGTDEVKVYNDRLMLQEIAHAPEELHSDTVNLLASNLRRVLTSPA
jgi:hypothetical protein